MTLPMAYLTVNQGREVNQHTATRTRSVLSAARRQSDPDDMYGNGLTDPFHFPPEEPDGRLQVWTDLSYVYQSDTTASLFSVQCLFHLHSLVLATSSRRAFPPHEA